jgi:hypothetical protein
MFFRNLKCVIKGQVNTCNFLMLLGQVWTLAVLFDGSSKAQKTVRVCKSWRLANHATLTSEAEPIVSFCKFGAF